MNKLDGLKSVKKPKAYLSNINLAGPGGHIAMTTDSGAASLMNESFIMKSLDDVDLTPDQIYILKEIGEYNNESLDEGVLAASEDGDTSVIANDPVSKSNENKENEMSKEAMESLQKQLEAVELKLATAEAVDAIRGYNLGEEVQKELASVIAAGADSAIIVKALDAMVVAKDAEKEEAIVKAAEGKAPAEETKLQKELSDEKGHDEKVSDVKKSLVDSALDYDEKDAK